MKTAKEHIEDGEKRCFTCKKVKNINEFYRHKEKLDGHEYSCKECRNAYSMLLKRKHYNPAKELAIKKERKKNPEFFEKERKALSERYKRNPEKFKARDITKYAVRSGKLNRLPCEVCQNPKSQAHHTDYSKPLEVKWLCHKHHAFVHRKPVPACLDPIEELEEEIKKKMR